MVRYVRILPEVKQTQASACIKTKLKERTKKDLKCFRIFDGRLRRKP